MRVVGYGVCIVWVSVWWGSCYGGEMGVDEVIEEVKEVA